MRELNVSERCCFWLSLVEGMSPAKRIELVKSVGSFEELYFNYLSHTSEIIEIAGNKHFSELCYYREDDILDARLNKLEDKDIDIIAIDDERYPSRLRNISDPPLLLYYRGKIALLSDDNMLAVVGSRRPTRYGKDITRSLVREVARAGVTIVSGLARGVDKVAHTVTLEESGRTIGVVAQGLDQCYPAENHELFERMAILGLVISEYPVGSTPYAYRFPERNRIISGLAKGTLVTEAGRMSGSLITMQHAIEQGRSVYLVPGNIDSELSMGVNDAIKELAGAMVTEPHDILKDFCLDVVESEEASVPLDDFESKLVEYITREDRHIDEITAFADNMSVNELLPLLSKLELFGFIKRLPGNYYGK